MQCTPVDELRHNSAQRRRGECDARAVYGFERDDETEVIVPAQQQAGDDALAGAGTQIGRYEHFSAGHAIRDRATQQEKRQHRDALCR